MPDTTKTPQGGTSDYTQWHEVKKGETLSNGHCCKTGLVWLNGRCDRPIATTLP